MRLLPPTDKRLGIAVGKFSQEEIFRIASKELKTETILTPQEYRTFVEKHFQQDKHPVFFRSRHYCVYRRGFETNHGMPVDKRVIFTQNGKTTEFEVPDIAHPNDRNTGLRWANGVLVFNVDKLDFNEGRRVVSVRMNDFDPKSDVFVIDKLADGVGTLTLEGYPIYDPKTTFFSLGIGVAEILKGDKFESGSTGFHGSVAIFVDTFYHRWTLNMGAEWDAPSAVVVKTIWEAIITP